MQTAYSASAQIASGKAGTVIAAALLGVLFVYVVGFLPVQAMHDAAHDTRHSITAPCH
jgi:cobalt transporter subunit CbtB